VTVAGALAAPLELRRGALLAAVGVGEVALAAVVGASVEVVVGVVDGVVDAGAGGASRQLGARARNATPRARLFFMASRYSAPAFAPTPVSG
jgi:hypothetical protein